MESLRILLVEDEPTSREALADLLLAEGHDPIQAGTGREAADLFGEHRPDLLILDYRLPDMTGLDVLEDLAALGPLPPAAILVTGHQLGQSSTRIAASLNVRVLRKPVSPPELLHLVRVLTHRARGDAEGVAPPAVDPCVRQKGPSILGP